MKTQVSKLVRSLRVICLAATGLGLSLHGQSVIQFSASTYNVTEGTPEVAILVQRTNDLDTVVGVDFVTTNLTATAGADYTDVSTTLTFLAGETNKLVTVPILNDGLMEGVETFQVTLSNSTGGAVLGARTNATVRITDNDKGLAFEFASYSVAEDAGSVLIGVVRGDDGDFPVTVDVVSSDATAKAGQDYTGITNTVTIQSGERVKLFIVPILNDSLRESSKTFSLSLNNPTGGGVLGSQRTATVTIVDNDPGVQVEFNQYWVQENEGALTVKVLRGNDLDLPLFTVDFATSNLTAVAGQDYTETTGTLTFAVGETVKTITIPIAYDEQQEVDEKCKVTLSNPFGGIVLGSRTTATITLLDTTGMAAHRFDRVAMLPDQSVQLTLGGGVSKRFKDYFDLYPIEVSTNLVDWTPLVTLQRTNSSTDAFTYTDSQSGTSSMRFYRTATNNLITAMLKPTGPRPVGMVNRWLTDPTRRNRYNVSTNGSFMVSIWYPAVPELGKLPVSFEDPALWHNLSWLGSFFDREPYFVSHAVPKATCATEGGSCPIVLYSHGHGGGLSQGAEKAENLASHGYVVVSVDHSDAEYPDFPEGNLALNLPLTIPSMTALGHQNRMKDLCHTLDTLTKWNRDDPIFAGRLDLGRVAVIGFSWGGMTAADFCRLDDRCRAAVLLDPGGESGNLLGTGLHEPLLQINNSSSSENALFTKAAHDAIWFQISSTEHGNFSDFYWFSYPGSLAAARGAARSVNAYTLWFLDKYLKGSTEPMPALEDYPRVINFKQK